MELCRKTILLFIFSSFMSVGLGQDIEWSETFGGTGYDDVGYSINQTQDGGYIITGYTFSIENNSNDVWLIKTDSNGNEEWNQTFGGTQSEVCYYVDQTQDGGYIMTGSTYSFGNGDRDLWLIKTDPDGNEEWNRTFGGTYDEIGYSIDQTQDGGYIIIGYVLLDENVEREYLLIKTNSNGEEEWSRTFGGNDNDIGLSIKITIDGGYIITGYTYSFGNGGSDIWLIKTDPDGNEEWNQTFGGEGSDYSRDIELTDDGGYIITGFTDSFGNGNRDVWLIKTDSNGIVEWNRTFGGTGEDTCYSVELTDDGGYIITGFTDSFGNGGSDVWLIKTDPDGNEEWSETFGGTGNDRGYDVELTEEGGYIIIGFTSSFGNDDGFYYDIWLLYVEECILGDINNDSILNILDIVSMITLILDGEYDGCGDVNSDGELNVLDVVILVNIILN